MNMNIDDQANLIIVVFVLLFLSVFCGGPMWLVADATDAFRDAFGTGGAP